MCGACEDRKFLYPHVHMIFSSMFDEAEMDPNEKRENKLVFISKNLDAEELKRGFKQCMHTQELEQTRLEQLRFNVGDQSDKSDWWHGKTNLEKGVVVQKRYRDEYMPPGLVAAYQVRLDDSGDLIYAPEDFDEIITNFAKQYEILSVAV